MPTLETSTADFLRLKDQADDPATPASGYAAFYSKGDSPYFKNDAGTETALAAGSGDVVGPASAVADNVVIFDSTTGKLIKDSGKAMLTLAASTYTPTLSNTTNVAASTPRACMYTRVGDMVTVYGNCDVDVTSAAFFVLGISLPIASNLANTYQLRGVCASGYKDTGEIYGDSTNDRASMTGTAVTTANNTYSFTFMYQVI